MQAKEAEEQTVQAENARKNSAMAAQATATIASLTALLSDFGEYVAYFDRRKLEAFQTVLPWCLIELKFYSDFNCRSSVPRLREV